MQTKKKQSPKMLVLVFLCVQLSTLVVEGTRRPVSSLSSNPVEQAFSNASIVESFSSDVQNKVMASVVESITATGDGLESGIVGSISTFIINFGAADEESINIEIEGPSQSEIQVHDLGYGLLGVAYTPTAPGVYIVYIKYYGKNIPGSPFMVKVFPA